MRLLVCTLLLGSLFNSCDRQPQPAQAQSAPPAPAAPKPVKKAPLGDPMETVAAMLRAIDANDRDTFRSYIFCEKEEQPLVMAMFDYQAACCSLLRALQAKYPDENLDVAEENLLSYDPGLVPLTRQWIEKGQVHASGFSASIWRDSPDDCLQMIHHQNKWLVNVPPMLNSERLYAKIDTHALKELTTHMAAIEQRMKDRDEPIGEVVHALAMGVNEIIRRHSFVPTPPPAPKPRSH